MTWGCDKDLSKNHVAEERGGVTKTCENLATRPSIGWAGAWGCVIYLCRNIDIYAEISTNARRTSAALGYAAMETWGCHKHFEYFCGRTWGCEKSPNLRSGGGGRDKWDKW